MKRKLLALLLITLTVTTMASAEGGTTISGTFFGTVMQGEVDLDNDGINGRGGHLHGRGSKFVYVEPYIDAASQDPVEGCPLPFTITPSGKVVFSTFLNSGAVFVEIDPGQTLCPVFVEEFTGTIVGGAGDHEGATGTASFTLADDRVLYAHVSGSPTMVYVNDGSFTLNID